MKGGKGGKGKEKKKKTLLELDVSDALVSEDFSGVARLDHIASAEDHSLSSLGSDLAGNGALNTLGAGLHDESHDAVARTADGEALDELVLEGLGLGGSAEATATDHLGEELELSGLEAEALVEDVGELADALALLAEDLLDVGGSDGDLGLAGGGLDLDAGVAVVGQLLDEELVDLSVEDTVGDELALLVDVDAGDGHCCLLGERRFLKKQ